MSLQYGKVISLILLERFGHVIEKVGTYLFQSGSNPLMYIVKYTELPLPKLLGSVSLKFPSVFEQILKANMYHINPRRVYLKSYCDWYRKVKEALCILIKYRLVTFKPNRNANIANYALHSDNVLMMLRYPKFISLLKTKFGEEAEILLEELLLRGTTTTPELIIRAASRLKETRDTVVTLPQIKDVFISLIEAKYLMRISKDDDEKPVPEIKVVEKEQFLVPTIDMQQLAMLQSSGADVSGVSDEYWVVNFDRFFQELRDQLIVNSITKKFDDNAGELVRVLLQEMYITTSTWADTSGPISILHVKDIINKRNSHPQLIATFDQYVSVVEQDQNNIIRKVGEASGGSFQVYLKEILTDLAWETVEQVVLEKFDVKAARIFRLVKTKRYIEPEQIQRLAMIPAKETKRLSYQLLEENFLELQELKKAVPGSNNNKAFTLFYIRLDQVVRMIMEFCYKALFNIMTRRHFDRQINKRIIDKKQRVDTITFGMRVQGATEEQLADIEEMITPPESEILEKIGKTMKKLNAVELEIDDTIFLLQMYLTYE